MLTNTVVSFEQPGPGVFNAVLSLNYTDGKTNRVDPGPLAGSSENKGFFKRLFLVK